MVNFVKPNVTGPLDAMICRQGDVFQCGHRCMCYDQPPHHTVVNMCMIFFHIILITTAKPFNFINGHLLH